MTMDHFLLLSGRNFLCGKSFLDLINFLPQNSTASPAITAVDMFSSHYLFFFFFSSLATYEDTSGRKQPCPSPFIMWLTDVK